MKRLGFLALICTALSLLGGCSAQPTDPAQSTGTTASSWLEQLAASYLSARAFDRARLSLRQNNESRLESAGRDLRLADSKLPHTLRVADAFVVQLIQDASITLDEATKANDTERSQLLDEANNRYRAALAFLPTDNKALAQNTLIDAQSLNALGYFLADRGTSRADWEKAEILTRLATERWDEPYGGADAPEQIKPALLYDKASGPQDSHAWALFKLGRLDEARAEAEQVLTTLATSPLKRPPSADIVYHLAEIYRVSGDANKSMPLYWQALNLNPDAETRSKIQTMLKLLGGQWRAV